MSVFTKWLDTFVSEKNINTDQMIVVDGSMGENHIPVQFVLDAIKSTTENEQNQIRNMIVKIDFHNGDVLDYFKHLAQAIAI